MQITLRFIRYFLMTSLLIACLLIVIATLLLRGSLPQYDGRTALPGLSAPVFVDRDELSSVTITGENRLDLTMAMGYIHAQERFLKWI